MEDRLDRAKTALILIDMQNDLCKGSYNPELVKLIAERNVLQNTADVVAAYHRLRVPVVFVKVLRRPDMADVVNTINDLVLQGKAPPAKEMKSLIEGTPGAEIVDELKPAPSDFVVVKRRTSAFYATNLDVYLRSLNIDTFMIGGVITNMGVESTVRDGRDRDFNMVVLEDCCASTPQQAHDYPITQVFPRMARVMSSQEAISLLERG